MDALRIALNLANTELVTGHDPDGSPCGPAPAMGRRIAAALDRAPVWIEHAGPSDIVASAHDDQWDICFLAADPARTSAMHFTQPWTRLEVCFAAAGEQPERFDPAQSRIASLHGAAYTLWLRAHLPSASVVLCATVDESIGAVLEGRADIAIGLRTFFDDGRLVAFADNAMTVDQAVGVNPAVSPDVAAAVVAFVDSLT